MGQCGECDSARKMHCLQKVCVQVRAVAGSTYGVLEFANLVRMIVESKRSSLHTGKYSKSNTVVSYA